MLHTLNLSQNRLLIHILGSDKRTNSDKRLDYYRQIATLRKEQPRKEQPRKEQPRKEQPRKEQPRKEPTVGVWTAEDSEEAQRQYRQRRMFHKWRVIINPQEKDWYDRWVEAQERRNIKNGLPPWYRDPPLRPPRPKGLWASVKWYFAWHWFNWEILYLAVILTPMFAVLLAM